VRRSTGADHARAARRSRGLTALLACASVFGVVLLPDSAHAQDESAARQAEARDYLRSGRYDEAIDAYGAMIRAQPTAALARASMMDALIATGQYEEAIDVGRAAPEPDLVAHLTGDALQALGRLDEAAQEYRRGAASGARWALTAEARLAELSLARGEVDDAMRRSDAFIDVYNNARGNLSSWDLVAVGRAVRHLGRTDPAYFQDALKAFDEASTADPTWAEPYVLIGNLFLEKYDSPAAKEEFEKVLVDNPYHPGALLGMAESLTFDGASEANDYFERLFDVNPDHERAHALVAMRYLRGENHERAREEAQAALDVNPNSLTALTAIAGSHLLRDDLTSFRRVRSQVLEVNPRFAGFDTELAELMVMTRRYEHAVERAAAAVALDSAAWEAWGLMGMNQMRLGDIESGRANLERAFAGDPYNPWFKNNLDLADTFERYRVHETEHFELFLHSSEDELLSTYLSPIAEEAYAALRTRYRHEPDLPIRAELYPNSADFSVRTLGEAGLGALGVSFGRVLVMDAPSARELGDYNWASVFWHELAHTFHLALSDNRVPRWFSEGLAVHEQRKARQGWGHQANISFLLSLRDDRLKKVSELNDGFMNPDYPQQVIHSYYQASLVFQIIEERYGFDVIRAMLQGYADGRTTEELFESLVGMPVTAFDDDFADYMAERFAAPLAGLVPIEETRPGPEDVEGMKRFVQTHPGDLIGRLQLGVQLYRAQDFEEAEGHFRAALEIFPQFGGVDSPLWFIAQIQHERGDLEAAAHTLARLTSISESHYSGMLLQSEILAELGRNQESADALDRAVLVWPYEMDLHERLADLHAGLGNAPRAAIERAAVVALDPVDRAEALYLLAVAQRDAGDMRGARRSVMGALELAPNYEDALEFLLALRGTGS
jgi:tetratricopeptide (TPR) repeat protein